MKTRNADRYVFVVIPAPITTWGFEGFDVECSDIQFTSSREKCVDWVSANTHGGDTYMVITMQKYVELYGEQDL